MLVCVLGGDMNLFVRARLHMQHGVLSHFKILPTHTLDPRRFSLSFTSSLSSSALSC